MERTPDSSTTDSTGSPASETAPTTPSEGRDEAGVDRLYDASADTADQRRALVGGDVPVAVYGLGKMGLPVASVLASVTGNVVGADVDPDVVESVNAGESHVRGEPGLDGLVADRVDDGSLRAVSDPEVAADEASIHVVIVPTLLTEENEGDLSIVDAVVDAIATGIDPGDAVFVESTVPPGTCADRIAPRLAERSGLDRAAFGVAFCPERTASGRALRDITESYPKIVGGVDAESTRVADLVYGEVTDNDVIPVRDATTAEATKVFGGVYRDVNIALANEFARYADSMGIDVREAIAASNTQPYSHVLSPGPGVGGHCIPVYPHFLLSEFAVESPLVRISRLVNDGMPTHAVDRLRSILRTEADVSTVNGPAADASAAGEGTTDRDPAGTGSSESSASGLDGVRVLVLGVTYRPGVNELRNSPSYELIEELSRGGATVDVCDPLVGDLTGFAATPVSMAEAAGSAYDAVVAVTPHEEFSAFDWDALEPTVVLDCHDAVDLDGTDHREYTLGRAIALDGEGPPAGSPDMDR
ncbi:nucleotide sugar dehydrogenase [Halorubrum trueperi]|uniref:UDP-N-acetyl-D-mannosamine dehydrogenase n=1 Tax=Halorubrum trueperi TaxID=2004704 RepID=A0ABD5UIY9_9EURY